MEDLIIRGLLADETVKIMAITGGALVEKARETHGLSRVCTAALGRTLMMTSMMGAQLKNEEERVTAMLKGGGEAGNIVCTADWTGRVKGYVENPGVELPPAPNGKLDVALAVGWFGDLTVVRAMGLKAVSYTHLAYPYRYKGGRNEDADCKAGRFAGTWRHKKRCCIARDFRNRTHPQHFEAL